MNDTKCDLYYKRIAKHAKACADGHKKANVEFKEMLSLMREAKAAGCNEKLIQQIVGKYMGY